MHNGCLKSKDDYKILLVTINNLWRYSNVGIDQIAGYLRKKGYHVDILYCHTGVVYEKVIKELELKYDLYGFSVNSSNYECCLKAVEYIKENQQNAVTVLGGGFPTRYYREIFEKTQSVDSIILGDGEIPMEYLLQSLFCNNTLFSSENIATHIDTENKVPYCNREISYYPAFDYYDKDKRIKNARKEYCIQTKNNICTGKCTFCTERKGIIVYKELSHIVNEISYVATNFGVRKFFITDDNIFDPNNEFAKQRVRELCLEIQKLQLNLVFKCYIKSISLSDTEEDNDLLKLMSDTGFMTMFVGIESGNEQDLKLYNKLVSVSNNITIIELLKRYGIVPQIGFINFNPYTTLETLRQNYEFLSKIEMNNLFMYVCSYLRIFKYTDIYYKAAKDGLLIENCDYLDDKSEYNFIDNEAKKIFDFVYEYMYIRVRNLDIEFEWLHSFFAECKKINPKAKTFDEEFIEMSKQQFVLIKEFFYLLFVENDLEKCKREVDKFLSYFEGLQPRQLQIHRQLLDLYLE
jgi:radical SAM superfamily enzyme YgiQ (UPF0313 family)